MYKVKVVITVSKEDRYSTINHAQSERETLSTEVALMHTVDDVVGDVLSDVRRQVAVRAADAQTGTDGD